MLDDPIVPAELYTAVFIYASLWSMFPIFLPGLSPLPLFVTVGVQLRCIQDTLIRVDYRGRKGGEGGEGATRHFRAFPTLDPSIGENFFS